MNLLDYDVFDLAEHVFATYPDSAPFEDFGPYHIKEPLGKGGMGEVFLAEDTLAGRLVAIKFLSLLYPSADLRERFIQEVKAQSKLEHPFIARLYEAGIHPCGTPYFAMEFVQGESLATYVRERNLSLRERLTLFGSICEAVQYAHNRLLIHRDLKPSNILVSTDGTPRLLDFGIAKQLDSDGDATQTVTARRFTPAYAAPEQILGEPVGVYTDVYALGVILYELLAGRGRHEGETRSPAEAEKIALADQDPPKPSVSPLRVKAKDSEWADLDVICRKSMQGHAPRRYQSVVELSQDIDRFLAGEPIRARPDTLTYRLSKFAKRNQRTLTTAAFVLASICAIVVFFTLRLTQERNGALRETAIATAMNRFLSEDLLAQSDPFRSGQAQESFADTVDRASTAIDLQFHHEPLIAARLHGTLAVAFQKRSEYERARREYTRAIVLFESVQGADSQEAAKLRLQQAFMEAERHQPDSLATAQSLVQRAQKALAGVARPEPALPIYLATAQGAIAILQDDPRQANSSFSLALTRLQLNRPLDGLEAAELKKLIAFSYIRMAAGAQAEPLLREVISTYSNRYGASSPIVLPARVYLAESLFVQRKYSEAIGEANLIYPVLLQRLGAEHQATLTLLGTRAASEGQLHRWDDAIRDDLNIYEIATRKQGPASSIALTSLSDAGLSQCRSGRLIEGERSSRQAFSAARQGFGEKTGITGGAEFSLAFCLAGLGRLGEASDLLRNINQQAVIALSGDSSAGADVNLLAAQIAVLQGDYGLAKQQVEQVGSHFDGPDADPLDRKALQELKDKIAAHKAIH